MKMFLKICLLIIVLFGSCHSFGMFDDEVERGDNYIDKLLQDMVQENGHEYDPYYLEDSVVSFWKKVTFINFTGEAKLHNGYITGLKTLHRPDHCRVEDKDGHINVKADLGAGVMNFHYDGTVKFMSFGPTISVHGVLHYLEIHMEFEVDSKTGQNGKLKRFAVDDMKGLDVTITGLGPLNWVMNKMIGSITYMFERYIKRLAENQVRRHLEERLPNYQFPIEEEQLTETLPESTTEEEIVEPETTTEEEIVEPETTTEEEIVEPETTTEEEIVEPETTTKEEIVEPETTTEEEIVDPETIPEENIVEPEETNEAERNMFDSLGKDYYHDYYDYVGNPDYLF